MFNNFNKNGKPIKLSKKEELQQEVNMLKHLYENEKSTNERLKKEIERLKLLNKDLEESNNNLHEFTRKDTIKILDGAVVELEKEKHFEKLYSLKCGNIIALKLSLKQAKDNNIIFKNSQTSREETEYYNGRISIIEEVIKVLKDV